MTDIISDSFKKYFTVGNTVLLIGILVTQVRWQTQVDNRLQILEKHASDQILHMPIQEKYQIFVPRIEIDSRLTNIESTLIEIKTDLKKNFDN